MNSLCKSVILIIFIMNSCTVKKPADLIVVNASVYVMDEDFSVAECLVVNNGKVVASGPTNQITAQFKSENVIDATGKFIYPGFNDAHTHFTGYGLNLMQYADLSGTKSPDEIYEILLHHQSNFNGKWLLGRGWDQNDWDVAEFPDKKRLDELFPDIPVYLIRVDGHAGWCNSKALSLAGIDNNTTIAGGKIIISKGEPTGILIDNAMNMVSALIPEPDSGLLKQALLKAQIKCLEAGLTSVTDCGVDNETIIIMKQLHEEGSLKMRINAMINPTEENFETFLPKGPSIEERLTINSIKLFSDGALGSRGALLLDDYADDPGNTGIQTRSHEYFDSICQLAYKHNFIVATHAIGDGANRMMLDIYGNILKGENNRRWRIEHAQIIAPEDFEKFAAYSIIPSIQATHCTSDMGWVEDRIGKDRIPGAYAYQTLLRQNGWLPNGTDFPVESINPLYTFFSSVFRTDHYHQPVGGWRPEEGLTREQTLRSMTSWAAKASFEENVKGSLESGKYADFIIIDTDLMSAKPNEVLNATIESTWVAGKKVYDSNE